ncbi:MAG TPA: isoprenylcysteine carboxylmethyltransferase family protein [Fibrobacteria bacterium]|nr:isoprenylcysteine carboxylmethyltransferase family protein [Fibrobacteria bacterium]
MEHSIPAYGLWSLVIINAGIFIMFAFSFFKPRTRRDWRTFGTFSAFIVALFVEMYGFPLTIYVLSGWLSRRYPQIDLLSHDAGHLFYTLMGWKGDPHSNPLHILSNVLIFGGFILLSASWRRLYDAQLKHQLAVAGPYGIVRHPQYIAFVTIMFGFLLQWPTLLTVAMFPVLTIMYLRLAKQEEKEVRKEFGPAWDEYAARVPAFFPRFRGTNPKPFRKTA